MCELLDLSQTLCYYDVETYFHDVAVVFSFGVLIASLVGLITIFIDNRWR